MTTNLLTPPKAQFFDANGNPLVGGKLYAYAAGTTTPQATYTDYAGGTANTNPVILDSRGEASVWLGENPYKFKLTTSTDVEVWTVDNVNQIPNYFTASNIGKALYPRTAAEIAASVTPSDYQYPSGDNRRYANWVDFVAVMGEGVEGHLWTNMTTNAMGVASGDMTLYVHGWLSVTATASMVNILRTQGRCCIIANGEFLMDGDNLVTGACLHYQYFFPLLQNVRWLDSKIGGAGGITSYDGAAYGPEGDATWINVTAENCADIGFSIRGQYEKNVTAATSANPIQITVTGHGFPNGAVLDFNEFDGDWQFLDGRRYPITVTGVNTFTIPADGSGFAAYTTGGTCAYRTSCVDLINCKTKGTTGNGNFGGSGTGFLYHLAGLKSLSMKGGTYEGYSTANCTAGFRCSHAEIVGSWHDYVGRGPTIGFNTHMFTIVGAAASNMPANAISADITDGVGTTAGIGVITGNVAAYANRGIRTTASNITISGNYVHQCAAASSGHITVAGEADNVLVDGNLVFRDSPNSTYDAVAFVENSVGYYGVNATNSDSVNSVIGPNVSMLGSFGSFREIVADTDLQPTDRVLLVDTTAGDVDIDLFDSTTSGRFTGFDVTIVLVAGANNVTLSLRSGSGGGTINGSGALRTVLFGESQERQMIRCLCVDGPTGEWVTTQPGVNYISSATVAWNPASLANNGTPETQTISVPGAETEDFVDLSFSQNLLGCVLFGKVTSSGVVTAYLVNATGSTQDVASGSLRALVWRRPI
jgi:hypothetical protein